MLLSLAILARMVPLPALPKGVLVGAFGVVVAFGLGSLILARTSVEERRRSVVPGGQGGPSAGGRTA